MCNVWHGSKQFPKHRLGILQTPFQVGFDGFGLAKGRSDDGKTHICALERFLNHVVDRVSKVQMSRHAFHHFPLICDTKNVANNSILIIFLQNGMFQVLMANSTETNHHQPWLAKLLSGHAPFFPSNGSIGSQRSLDGTMEVHRCPFHLQKTSSPRNYKVSNFTILCWLSFEIWNSLSLLI